MVKTGDFDFRDIKAFGTEPLQLGFYPCSRPRPHRRGAFRRVVLEIICRLVRAESANEA